ncbi:MAG: hypothetical protein ABJA81_00020 [Nocardioidaceae bacterium]
MDYVPEGDVRLHIVRDAIRRRWPLVLLVAVVFAAAAAGLVAGRPTEFTAAARTLLRPIPGNALSADATQSSQQITIAMETEAQLVTSPDVVTLVNDKLGSSLVAGSAAVVASVPANTEIIRIEFTAGTPQEAQDGAQAFADAFLRYREQQAKDTQNRQIDSLRSQLTAAQKGFDKASKASESVIPPPGSAAQVQLFAGRVATLQDSIGNAEAIDTNAGSVVTPAALPQSAAGLSKVVLIAAAGIAGFAFGLLLTIWLERRDDRIRVGSGSTIGGVPLLADLSRIRKQGLRLIAQRDADDPVREAYRLARAGLLATTSPPSTVVVSALSADVNVSLVAVNLGLSLVGAGYAVTVVDASIAGPKVAQLLKIDAFPGVADLLSDKNSESPRLTQTHGLKVLPAGSDPVGMREHYAGAGLKTLITRLRRRTDFVIVAAPPAGTPENGAATAASEGLVLVLANRHDTHAELITAIERARRAKIGIIGAITVPPPGTSSTRSSNPSPPSSPPATDTTTGEPPDHLGREPKSGDADPDASLEDADQPDRGRSEASAVSARDS